ncbi:MAG TPA: MerR family transcriptional regulator [Flavisolibacter sp.]|jgi:DNA-binding transcriptional MerR regulator|nr:MerR family transcriptional regulator [Flavisolibacter sp.]
MSFTIKELESLSGIKAHTIRIWEQRYNFLQPSRTQTNIRRYNNEELKTLLTVALLNKYGYKISKIDEMQPDQRTEAVLQLQQPDAYGEHIINELIGCMIDLKGIEFERILTNYIQKHGIEGTITGLIFLFLERVGILWQTNRLRPVQEHIVSNIIRQKIIVAIEGLPLAQNAMPLFVLFLPEGEHHELGLLYVYYLLRKKGIPTIYLGANVPVKDIHYVVEAKSPSSLYLHLTSFPGQPKFQRLLLQLQKDAKDCTIIISGYVAQLIKRQPIQNVELLQSLSSVQAYISSLN